MELSYGGGHNPVILSLRDGLLRLFPHEVSAEDLGGHQYYESRSGRSGAASVPWSLGWTEVPAYRVDVSRPEPFRPRAETIPGWRICAPYEYWGTVPHDWPVVMWRKSDPTPLFVSPRMLGAVLRGTAPVEERIMEWEIFWRYREGRVEDILYHVTPVRENYPHEYARVLRRLMVAITPELQFCGWDSEVPRREVLPNFFANHGWLALAADEDWVLYRVRGNHCRCRVEGFEGALDEMRTWPHLHFISRRCYIEQRHGEYRACGIFYGFRYDYELTLSPERALRALYGDEQAIREIVSELRNGARQKKNEDRDNAARRATREERLPALIDAAPGVLVSLVDSVAAGNCEPGTRDFARRHFPDAVEACQDGTEAVQVRHLRPHLGHPEVVRVLTSDAVFGRLELSAPSRLSG